MNEHFSLDAEQQLLGALILEPFRIDNLKCRVVDLWNANHKLILKAMLELHERGTQIDLFTLGEKLEADGELKNIGGIVYLGSLAQNSAGGANLHVYEKSIMDKALKRELIATASGIIERCNDVASVGADLVADAEAEIFAVNDKRESHEPVEIKTAVHEALDHLGNIIDGVQYLSSSLDDLDKITGGLHGGAVYVIAARPSMGKTALACSIAHGIAKQDKSVYFATLEMPRREIAARLIAIDANVNIGNVKNWEEEDYERLTVGAHRVEQLNITIDHEEGLGIAKLRSRARRTKRKKGLDCIVVDYLQLMKHKADNREREVAALSGGIKSLAKELDVPVILLAQLNRECDARADKRPLLSDLRESGAIEQDADVVIMLYRDEVYNKDTMYKGVAELLVRKNRHGATGDVYTSFSHTSMKFGNMAKEWEKPIDPAPSRGRRGFD